MGWHAHDSRQTESVAQALRMALRARQSRQRLVHHSDRGLLLKVEPLLQRPAELQQARRMLDESVRIHHIGRRWPAYAGIALRPRCQPNSGWVTRNLVKSG
jgi:putative transposase